MRRCILWMMGVAGLLLASCQKQMTQDVLGEKQGQSMLEVITSALDLSFHRKELTSEDITVSKSLLFDRYTLDDVYPYGDTVRSFKWDAIRKCLAFVENIQAEEKNWGVFQNYQNRNREAPLVRKYIRNAYRRVADTLGVERYQSVPLYLPEDTVTPERYGRDGFLAHIIAGQ